MSETVRLFVAAMLARAYPRFIGVHRYPMWVVQEAILPVLSVAAFCYAYRAMGAPEQFVGFAVLGGAMTAFWLNILWSMGAHFYWERDSGNLELFIMAPAPLMGVLAGMALGGMVLTMVRASFILSAGVLFFGVTFYVGHWPALLGVFALTVLALYGLGMVFASAFLYWGREAYHLVNLLQEPVFLLSGTNYPVKALGAVAATAAAVVPLTAGMDAMRQLLFPGWAGGLYPVPVEAALLAVLSAAFILLAGRLLHAVEERARRDGKLTLKWQ